MRKYGILILLACIITENVLAAGGLEDINDLSLPDVQIELPPELVGIFKFEDEDPSSIYRDFYGCIEIYEDNRYWWHGGNSGQEWGYIIEDKGDYCLFPFGNRANSRNEGYYIDKKTKIVFIENGISFTSTKWNEKFVALKDPDGFKNLITVTPEQ